MEPLLDKLARQPKVRRLLKPSLLIYLIVNFIILFLYCHYVLAISEEAKSEHRNYYDGVNGITYFCTGSPVFLLCLLFNIMWVIKALVDIFRRRDYSAAAVLGVVVVVWAVSYPTVWHMTILPDTYPDFTVKWNSN
jgi:hypothetical protein